jgi:hypothetical protein
VAVWGNFSQQALKVGLLQSLNPYGQPGSRWESKDLFLQKPFLVRFLQGLKLQVVTNWDSDFQIWLQHLVEGLKTCQKTYKHLPFRLSITKIFMLEVGAITINAQIDKVTYL